MSSNLDALITDYREQMHEVDTAAATHSAMVNTDDPDYEAADDFRNYSLADTRENALGSARALADALLARHLARQSVVVGMVQALVESAPDIGLTCGEAETIAQGIATLGHRHEAIAFLVGHGQSESETEGEDEHHLITGEAAAAIVDALTRPTPVAVWNAHTNDIGDHCPFSGEPVDEEDEECPQGCHASARTVAESDARAPGTTSEGEAIPGALLDR